MKISKTLLVILLSGLFALGCEDKADSKKDDNKADKDDDKGKKQKKDDKDADDNDDGDNKAKSGSAKAGDSCKGISASDGLMGCDGKNIIFCSSYSDYEWKVQQECDSECIPGDDGKSASCK